MQSSQIHPQLLLTSSSNITDSSCIAPATKCSLYDMQGQQLSPREFINKIEARQIPFKTYTHTLQQQLHPRKSGPCFHLPMLHWNC